MTDFASELRRLATQLDLELTSAGTPANPLLVVDLDRWQDAPPECIERAAGLIAGALPITVAVLTRPPTLTGPPPLAGPPTVPWPPPGLEPLITAATLTLGTGPAAPPHSPDISGNVGRETRQRAEQWSGDTRRAIIPVGDIPGMPDLAAAATVERAREAALEMALERVREAVLRSPRAAIACGQLVRQTAVLGTGEGLAAEATAYSLLLGGVEFAGWLGERGAARRRAAASEPVLVRRDGGRLSIVLNVPERRNAFSASVREALLDAVLLAEADETIESVELSGAGPAFCSGGDLDEFGTATDLVAAWLVRLSRAPWRVIDRIAPKVTVYAHGACVGAGTEIAAFAGRVVAAPAAFFALPEVRMGLVPGAGGSVSVVRRIGRWRAAWLMLTGERLPAATALRWGLVDEIAPPR